MLSTYSSSVCFASVSSIPADLQPEFQLGSGSVPTIDRAPVKRIYKMALGISTDQVKHGAAKTYTISNACWHSIIIMATHSKHYGDYDLSEAMLLKALSETKRFSLKDPRVLHTVRTLADLYYQWGNISEAKRYFHLEARIAHLVFGQGDTRSADALSRLGTAYVADQSYPAAQLCFRQARQVYAAVCGSWSREAWRAADNLAMIAAICSRQEACA